MAGEGKDTKGMEDEYKTFLAELGGKDPRDLAAPGQPSPLLPHCAWLGVLSSNGMSSACMQTRLSSLWLACHAILETLYLGTCCIEVASAQAEKL